MTRALGIIRLSKTADPASTSLERQREIIESYAAQNGIQIVGWAEDKATSAFHVPPEKRKAISSWLARPEEFDCLIYWRQDRLVRRYADFIGMIQWSIANGKALYSATEGTGDVTQHANVLIGFIGAWQSESESMSTSARVKQSMTKLAEQGRYPGGRVGFGFRSVKKVDGPGYELVPDEKQADLIREAARRVISGESVNAVTSDFNRRGIPTAYGKAWTRIALKKVLTNTSLLNGIIPVGQWGELQSAISSRKADTKIKTYGASLLLDIVFCDKCGSKLYKVKNPNPSGGYYLRCKNELHRTGTTTPCSASRIPYANVAELVAGVVLSYADCEIEERQTSNAVGTRALRLDAISRELIELPADYAAKRVTRAEMLAKQAELLDEQQALEEPQSDSDGSGWIATGETVGQRWERLDDAARRLWLLRLGLTFQLHYEPSVRFTFIEPVWEDLESARERIIRPA